MPFERHYPWGWGYGGYYLLNKVGCGVWQYSIGGITWDIYQVCECHFSYGGSEMWV